MEIAKEYEQFELSNGIRVVYKEMNHTKISHLALMLDIGSRDEALQEQGLAHFLEHMTFKGTKNRSNIQIIEDLESLGGELNAYTTKEKICFYISILSTYIDKAVEVLADIVFHSVYPSEQLEKEKTVVLEEIAMSEDNPDESIQDNFEIQLFPNHSLGRNIVGTRETVANFKSEDIRNFFYKNLNTEKVVFSYVGNMPKKKIHILAEKHLKPIPHQNNTCLRAFNESYRTTDKLKKKHAHQAHFVLGLPSLAISHVNRVPFFFWLIY